MPERILDAYEIGAVLEAGDKAGQFAADIGKTDIAKMDDGEWREFLRLIVTEYEQSLRRNILSGAPPF